MTMCATRDITQGEELSVDFHAHLPHTGLSACACLGSESRAHRILGYGIEKLSDAIFNPFLFPLTLSSSACEFAPDNEEFHKGMQSRIHTMLKNREGAFQKH